MAGVTLFGPWQVHGPKARTTDGYRLYQRRLLAHNGKGEPWLYLGNAPEAFISGAKVVIECRNCGNAPVVDVAARLALCCECGAVYERVQLPADFADLEAVLSVRPVLARHSRHAETNQPATIRELDQENQQRGLPKLSDIPRRDADRIADINGGR